MGKAMLTEMAKVNTLRFTKELSEHSLIKSHLMLTLCKHRTWGSSKVSRCSERWRQRKYTGSFRAQHRS